MRDPAYIDAEKAKFQRGEWADAAAIREPSEGMTSEQTFLDWLMRQLPFQGSGS